VPTPKVLLRLFEEHHKVIQLLKLTDIVLKIITENNGNQTGRTNINKTNLSDKSPLTNFTSHHMFSHLERETDTCFGTSTRDSLTLTCSSPAVKDTDLPIELDGHTCTLYAIPSTRSITDLNRRLNNANNTNNNNNHNNNNNNANDTSNDTSNQHYNRADRAGDIINCSVLAIAIN
jgi:hypothetical protein